MSQMIPTYLVDQQNTPIDKSTPLAVTISGGGGGTVDQGATNSDATDGWSVRLTDGAAFIVPAKTGQLPAALGATTAAGSVSVGIATDQLSTLATAAKQDTGNASLASIDTKLTAPLSVTAGPGNVVNAANSSTTPLAGGATFIGTGVDLLNYAGVEVFAFANVAGTLYLEYSTDNSNWDLSLSYSLAAGVPLHIPNGTQSRYFRVRYTNGGSAQASFRLQTILLGSIPAPHVVAISSVPLAGNDAILTQAEIIGLSSAGGGTYVPVKVAPSGAVQVGGEVTVTGAAASGAAVSGNPVLVAGSNAGTTRTVSVDASGQQVVVGPGTAGSASGGVLTVQGVASMTPVQVSQATAANLNATVTQGAGSGAVATFWYTRGTDGTNTTPTMDAVSRAGFQKITDGTNTAAVKAASTAAVAADPAVVVAVRPQGSSFFNCAGVNETRTLKTGAGVLRRVVINPGSGGSTCTIYDNTAGSGTVIHSFTTSSAGALPLTLTYEAAFSKGLTYTTASGTQGNLTFIWD